MSKSATTFQKKTMARIYKGNGIFKPPNTEWIDLDPAMIHEILITHQDTDHVGAVERDRPGLFKNAVLYLGETENRYLTGVAKQRVFYHLYALPQVYIDNQKVLLTDRQVIKNGIPCG